MNKILFINICSFLFESCTQGHKGRGVAYPLQVGRTRDRFQAVALGIYSVAADISVCRGVDSASKN